VYPSRPNPALAPTTAGPPRKRVLLIEDDPDAALFFVHVLTRQGDFHVTHRLDPYTALDLARSARWDLVIVDLDLPGMTGLDLVGALRSTAPELPVLLVTAQDTRQLPEAIAASDALLAKPVPPGSLLAAAAALLAGSP
jgi:DNA-binding response OmpR family regulator